MGLSQDIAGLVELAGRGGRDLSWAQAAGGNASVKSEPEDRLLVKASGLRLREMTGSHGWVSLPLKAVRGVLEDRALEALPHAIQQDEAGRRLASLLLAESPKGRPSLEAEFHALGAKFCLHAHLVSCLGPLSLENGREWFEKALAPLGLAFAWVEFRPPGHSLARQVALALEKSPGRPKLALMRNHGAIAWGEDGQEALLRLARLDRLCQSLLGPVEAPPAPMEPRAFEALDAAVAAWMGASAQWKVSHDPWVRTLALGGEYSWMPLCPDDPIYCGQRVPAFESLPADFGGLFGVQPRQAAFALLGQGVALMAKDAKALLYMEEMLSANAKARFWGRRAGILSTLR